MTDGPPSPLTRRVWSDLQRHLTADPSPEGLARALRHLAKWRAHLLTNTHRARSGDRIAQGPFAGMVYDVAASEGGALPRLLGTYEAALHPVIAEIVAARPARIIDLGCAEGYYAVGLARLLPETEIIARDSDPTARERCARLAAANGVAERIAIGGAVDAEALNTLLTPGAVLICDIEGGEDALLDPGAVPALAGADILVEAHDCFHPGLAARLAARFAATHDVRRIERSAPAAPLPDWMDALSDLDRALALWEWRAGPTPWLWMRARR